MCRVDGSPPMTWVQFSKAFLKKYVPHRLKKRMWDEFTYLVQELRSASEYGTWFYNLDRHAAILMPTKHEWVYKFGRGLTFFLRLAIKQMVASG